MKLLLENVPGKILIDRFHIKHCCSY